MRKASYVCLQGRCNTSKTPGDFQVQFGKKGLHQRVQASELTTKNVFCHKIWKSLKGNLRSVYTENVCKKKDTVPTELNCKKTK